MLICPVHGCQAALLREERRFVCPRGHSFDIARSGYVNLLQPQDRRSKQPGDMAEAIQARRRIHDRGVTEPLLRGIGEMAGASPDDMVLDAGCGEGFYAGMLGRRFSFVPHGIDISVPAIDAAARRYPDGEWVVANADRVLPYSVGSFSLILSITGRMNAAEFKRVLREDGRLLVALAGPEDLIELRGRSRDRVERTIQTFESGFVLENRSRVTASADMDEAGVRDVLLSIYRPIQSEPARAMGVTFSLDLLMFRTRS